MKKEEFRELAKGSFLYLDGATGSNLQKRGMPIGVCPEKWVMENKEVLIDLQREYVEAGSQILYAPTFTCNRIKLKEYGLEKEVKEINKGLVAISKEAAGKKAYVAGNLTMTGEQLKPIGSMDFETLIDVYKEQIQYLVDGGADLLVVETMMSLMEARAALIAAKETCDLPVFVTMTFEEDGKTLYGTDAVTAFVTLQQLGADAVGANCSTGPDKMVEIIESMREFGSIPIISKPNAGMPSLSEDGGTIYDMDPKEFGREMKKIVEAGATILGGCCGTDPEYIRELVKNTSSMKPSQVEEKGIRFLSSERHTISFGLDSKFLIVGERINPTGKKKLQEEIRKGQFERIRDFAEEQEEKGASILDVNMGMSGIDEKAVMLKAIETVTEAVSLPIAIDSSHVDVIEAALRHYPGRALVNSISYEQEKFQKLLPIVKKYGAMFILLPLSDKGLPKDLEEKKDIIGKIMDRALELGMKKEDIVVDGLVTTVGANPMAAIETMETIRYCKGLGLATIVGLSNISFGLPERSYVNSTFLTMAIEAGLTMAIANPSQELLVSTAFASDLLMNKKGGDIHYIEYISGQKEKKEPGAVKEETIGEPKELSWKEELRESVLRGSRNKIEAQTKEAVEKGVLPEHILNEALLPAINEVGDLFEKGKYFLPQLIASAEAMKISIEYIEPMLRKDNAKEKMPVVVIATVEGDIHDIGKNLVALMLKNYGFQVIDLGKDVPKEEIIKAAKEHGASIIALSALMTTTMQEMRHVITYAREQGVDAKVMIGGAVITQEYADEIGADGYSKDAADAVKLAKEIVKEEGIK
ncbi:MAG: dihydropteroate synthase [Lachnospiraceae bacterium]|jgi:5-methyltetrahydrofolate--homocysteine methyltransferase|nr:dihydropteroate synthase [Lachnospiraceae bacterium]